MGVLWSKQEKDLGGGNFPLCIKICLKYRRYGGRQSCTNRSVALGSNPMHIIFVCFNFYVLELWCGKDENKHKKRGRDCRIFKKNWRFPLFWPFSFNFFCRKLSKIKSLNIWAENISFVTTRLTGKYFKCVNVQINFYHSNMPAAFDYDARYGTAVVRQE